MHLGGATGLQANFGRKLRAHKVTSAGLDDYVTNVVDQLPGRPRATARRFADWVARADEELLRGDKALEVRRMSEPRRVPFHCPYCGGGGTCSRTRSARLGVPGLPAGVHA